MEARPCTPRCARSGRTLTLTPTPTPTPTLTPNPEPPHLKMETGMPRSLAASASLSATHVLCA